MNTIPITIEEGRVTIRPAVGTVWLTQHEIARIFNVYVSAVGSNIRLILKSGVLRKEEICRHQNTENGSIMTLYNLEIITALAFRLKSRQVEWFRQWIIQQVTNPLILWKIPGMDTMLN